MGFIRCTIKKEDYEILMQDLSKHETDLHIKGQDWEHWSNLNRLKLGHGKKDQEQLSIIKGMQLFIPLV